ncbi:MAG: hypothetical protein AAF590_08095 [Pseudomonadota bacterium]
MAWALLCLAVASNIAANMAFKLAMASAPTELALTAIARFLFNPYLWVGATCCGVLLLSYLTALRELELTISYAFVISLSLIGITVLSPVLLGDGLTMQRGLGVALVVAGLVLLIHDRGKQSQAADVASSSHQESSKA